MINERNRRLPRPSNQEGVSLTNKLIFVQIYIPNLMKKLYSEGTEKLTKAKRFILTIILPDIKEAKEIAKKYDIMEEYMEEAIEVSEDDNMLESYDKVWALKDQGYREGKEVEKHQIIRPFKKRTRSRNNFQSNWT